jgi:hypothetical protein
MMNKIVLTLSMLVISATALAQDKMDTIYYNKEQRGVPNRIFADYIVYTYEPQDTLYAKQFRCYYQTGELRSEGEFIKIDKYDAQNNIFDKRKTVYSKDGQTIGIYEYDKGILHGNVAYVNNDGVIEMATYTHGEMTPRCIWRQYANGVCLKYDADTNEQIKDKPSLSSDAQVVYIDGAAWEFYEMNGIVLGLSARRIKEYGSYMQLSFMVANYTPNRIDFDVNNILSVKFEYFNNKGVPGNVEWGEILEREEYMRIVRNRQAWQEISLAVLMAMSSASEDYNETITTNVSSSYGSATIRTKYYNRAAYEQRMAMDAALLCMQNYVHKEDLQHIGVGYINANTLFPNQELSGYIMIPDERPKGNRDIRIICELDKEQYEFRFKD